MNKYLLSDSREVYFKELLDTYKEKNIYTYFVVNNKIILDKVSHNNILNLVVLNYDLSGNYAIIQNPDSGEWIDCSTITDEYNSRIGKYSKIYENLSCSVNDYPLSIIHMDGNLKNNNPENITRSNDKRYISMDYYRSVSNNPDHRKLVSKLYPFICMKKEYNKYIDEDFYNLHSHDYTSTPVTWNYISLSLGGGTDYINKYVDTLIRDNKIHEYPPKKSNPMKVYIASGFFCDDDRSLVPFMESFLENRGYQVYSPSRDGIVLTPNATLDDRLNTYKENVKGVSEADLLIVCVNNKDTGCFVGDTKIRLMEGNEIKIKDMKRSRKGYKILTYSDSHNKFVQGFTYGSIVTRSSQPIVEVTLTTRESVYCTADHPFMTSSGKYLEASKLKKGTKLKTMYKSFNAEVLEVNPTDRVENVYGLEVMTDDHNYVLSSGGLVVKNTSVELGLKAGLWESEKSRILFKYNNDPEIVTEDELAVLTQETPRVITFSDNGTNVNVMLLGAVLKHCSSWKELSDYLDYVDEVGVKYAKRDSSSIKDVKVY